VPLRGLRGAHRQTVITHFLPRHNALPAPEARCFQVEEQVQVRCLCHWQARREAALTVIIVHGLEGSCESQYVIGTANKAWTAGMNVVRMNVRNCGGTEALGPTLYHSGMSGDIGAVVRTLVRDDHLPAIALAGFSMGGNQVLKLAAEWGAQAQREASPSSGHESLLRTAPRELCAVAAVSPAVDLAESADALHLSANRLYEWRFLLSLGRRLRRKGRLFPQLYQPGKRWWRSIRDFDNCVTAPHCGFRDAADYYAQASAGPLLGAVRVPALIIHAQDDPFVRITPATRARIAANPNIRFVESAHGGHCGFLGEANEYDGRWAERQIVEFFGQFR
jgi:predicted alpha/beta-fold hydrolase